MGKYITKPNEKLHYPAKVNVTDPTNDNFTQPLSNKEILDELEISKDDSQSAYVGPQDIPRTSPSNVPRMSPKDPI